MSHGTAGVRRHNSFFFREIDEGFSGFNDVIFIIVLQCKVYLMSSVSKFSPRQNNEGCSIKRAQDACSTYETK